MLQDGTRDAGWRRPRRRSRAKRARVVSDAWPPFTDVPGRPRLALDLVGEALSTSGVGSGFEIRDWQSAIEALEKGQLDGSPAIWKTPERERYLVFSRPYLENRLVLVGRKGTDVSAHAVGELAGKRLALVQGYAYGKGIVTAPGVRIVRRKDDAACLRAVLKKEADYLLLDQLVVEHLYEHYGDKARRLIEAGKVVLDRHLLHLAIRKSVPGSQGIVQRFDRAIAAMRADGRYNVLLKLPWIVADTDSDGRLEYVASSKSLGARRADPRAAGLGYLVFDASSAAAGSQAAPRYTIDGKSYDTWGDATRQLPHANAANPKGLYRFSTGVVLLEF